MDIQIMTPVEVPNSCSNVTYVLNKLVERVHLASHTILYINNSTEYFVMSDYFLCINVYLKIILQ